MALDEAVRVQIDQPGTLDRLTLMYHRHGPFRARRVVTKRYPFADQTGVDLVQTPVERDGAIGLDLALGLEQEQLIELGIGVRIAHRVG